MTSGMADPTSLGVSGSSLIVGLVLRVSSAIVS